MKKIIFFTFFLFFFIQSVFVAKAQDTQVLNFDNLPADELYKAEIISIGQEYSREFEGYVEQIREVSIRILDGKEKNKVVDTMVSNLVGIDQLLDIKVGQKVVVDKIYHLDSSITYNIIDQYRLNPLIIIFIIFIVLAIILGRWKGVGSLFGLACSVLILALYIVPGIISGGHPLLVTLIGTFFIAATSLFLAHGFNKRTAISWLSTMLTLIIALVMSNIFVKFAYLFGTGTEESFYLQTSLVPDLDLRGLLLAGIAIGTLGVLDDITTAQTAVVGEIHQANQQLSIRELYQRGLVVGREHIASLVNTLVLAYAGAALPLFILFSINQETPLWLKINNPLIAEELVRTIIGSAALMLAVPISTILAAYFLRYEKMREESSVNLQTHRH